MLTIPIESADGFSISEDGKTVEVIVSAKGQGGPVALSLPAENVAALISVMVEARAKANEAAPIGKQPVVTRDFSNFEVGTTMSKDTTILLFDRNMPTQVALRAHPKTARQLGKALIAQARANEHTIATRVKN